MPSPGNGSNGRFVVRAVARLLLCKELDKTVLFVDKPYDEAGGTPSPEVLDPSPFIARNPFPRVV